MNKICPQKANDEIFKLLLEFLKKVYGESSEDHQNYLKSPIGLVLMVTGKKGDATIMVKGDVFPKHFRFLQSLMPTEYSINEDQSKIVSTSELQNN